MQGSFSIFITLFLFIFSLFQYMNMVCMSMNKNTLEKKVKISSIGPFKLGMSGQDNHILRTLPNLADQADLLESKHIACSSFQSKQFLKVFELTLGSRCRTKPSKNRRTNCQKTWRWFITIILRSGFIFCAMEPGVNCGVAVFKLPIRGFNSRVWRLQVCNITDMYITQSQTWEMVLNLQEIELCHFKGVPLLSWLAWLQN